MPELQTAQTPVFADSFLFLMFLIFTGAAIVATLALYARQALLVAYILLGVIIGPFGFEWITLEHAPSIKAIANIGIVFLLFLLGLNLQPRNLINMLSKTTRLTIISTLLFACIGFVISIAFGFAWQESLLIGVAMTFSSTILGLKLLPTTVLHHKHAGEIIVSILLLQDLVAILVLLVLQGMHNGGDELLWNITVSMAALPVLALGSWLFGRYVLLYLIQKFSKIQEYIFLTAIGWCLGMAELAEILGLSHEIGAFIAGVVLATSPIARFIAESLKPLRDFFLILFFFSLGASLNLNVLPQIIVPALVLALAMLFIKPYVFRFLLVKLEEKPGLSLEMGFRLGQISEFSLLIAVMAQDFSIIQDEASYLIQIATLISFAVSSYFIVMRYPTPIAVSDDLRRD